MNNELFITKPIFDYSELLEEAKEMHEEYLILRGEIPETNVLSKKGGKNEKSNT